MTKIPVTSGIKFLKDKGAEFEVFCYDYTPRGGAAETAQKLNVDLHKVVKTIVMQAEGHDPFLVLMHGDCEISTRKLARYLGVKKVFPATLEVAKRWTGYVFGGTSPFGTRKSMRILIEETILSLDEIYINGGSQGVIVKIKPDILLNLLNYEIVNVSSEGKNEEKVNN